ncbi:MAG: hypothetical protein ACI8XO_002464, partial [Verrucomicrobiales bacterium]
AFGVAALVFCMTRSAGLRKVFLARLVAVNVVAAMIFLFLFLPNALQISEWGEVNDHHHLNVIVLENIVTQLVFGLEVFCGRSVETETLTSFTLSLNAHPLLGWIAIGLVSLSLIFGTIAIRRRAPRRSLLLLAVFCGASLSLLLTWKLHQHFYHRYVVAYTIVPFLSLVGIGAVELAKMVPLRPRPLWLPLATTMLVIVSFTAFTRDQRMVLNTHSYAPFREVAQYVGREAKVGQIDVIGYGLGGRVFQIYYPEGKFADTLEELDKELAAAEEHGGPVFVVLGYKEFNSMDPRSAAGAAKIANPDRFEEVAAYPGIDRMFYFRIYRRIDG